MATMWVQNPDGRGKDKLRLCIHRLENLKHHLESKQFLDEAYFLTREEEILKLSVEMLIASYQRKDYNYKDLEKRRVANNDILKLHEDLESITKERDELLDKIYEAQIQGGLLFKFLFDKFKFKKDT